MLIVGAVLCGMRFPWKKIWRGIPRIWMAWCCWFWRGNWIICEERNSYTRSRANIQTIQGKLGATIRVFCLTKCSYSCTTLHEVILKATVLLFNHTAIVKNFVCDGCSSNKAAMRLFQIHGNFSRAKVESENAFYIRHPMARSVKIYWLFDAPHLLKCRRNQILKHKEVQVVLWLSLISIY